jgi:hypothetical protein
MKLKFLTTLSQEKVDLSTVLRECLGVKKVRWYHTIYFIKTYKRLYREAERIRALDPKKITESSDCKIKRPTSIDSIAFGATVELQILFQNPGEREIGELMTETIALSCYESCTGKLFDSDTEDFKEFRELVANSDLEQMLGLYNWIDKNLNEAQEKWNTLFSNVRIYDQDWDNAGGRDMEKFSVLNTIKAACSDFNLDYYRVLQVPYNLIQASSLSKATQDFIQDKMRIAIEARMKSKKNV